MAEQIVRIPLKYEVTVILPGHPPRAIRVEGRTGKMIAWLVQHRARIERIGTGSFTFHMGLTHFEPAINEHFPRQAAEPENPDGPVSALTM